MSIYSDFVEKYNDLNLTCHDIRRLNNLNHKEFKKLQVKAIENGDIPIKRHMNRTNASFYSKTKDGYYRVQKQYADDYIYIGRFPNSTTAKYIVDKCIQNNWELTDDLIFEINKLKVKSKVKNYSIVGDYYIIQKSVDGVNIVFAALPINKYNENMVEFIVDELRSVNWDKNKVDGIIDKIRK